MLAVMLAGIAYLARAYGIGATEPGGGRLPEHPVATRRGRGRPRAVLLHLDAVDPERAGVVGEHRLRRFPTALPGDRAGWLSAPRLRAAGRRLVYSQGIYVLAGPLGAAAHRLRRDHRQADSAVRGRGLPGLHAVAGRHGRALGARAGQARVASDGVKRPARSRPASTLIVVLVSKFVDGAWVMLLLVPALLVLFTGMPAPLRKIAIEIANPKPLDVANIQPPIVILPMREWNKMSQKGLTLRPEAVAGHPRRAGSNGRRQRRCPVGRLVEHVETPARGGALARTQALSR